MKKMVCEICNSQHIRKENGVFICQECGTEYSVEDAKKLLKEVDDIDSNKNVEIESNSKPQNTDVQEKEKLISLLYYWAYNISRIPDTKFVFGYENVNVGTDNFWTNIVPDIINMKRSVTFPKIDASLVYVRETTKRLLKEGNESYIVNFNDIDEKTYNKKIFVIDSVLGCYIAKRFYDSEFLDEALENLIKGSHYYNDAIHFFNSTLNSIFDDTGYFFGVSKKNLGISVDYCAQNTITHCSEIYEDVKANKYNSTLMKIEVKGIRYKKTVVNEIFQKEFDNILKKSNDCVNEFINQHNELMDYYESKYEELCLIVKDIVENCKLLEKDLFLPYKYRDLSTILSLIDILKDGKATNWKELINLYDTQKFREGVYEKLDIINSKLDNIQNTMIAGFTTVIDGIDKIKMHIASIDDRMNVISKDISKIKKNSFITMWNTL